MTAPTQAFPPWLSPSPVTVTQGGTVVLQTTVIQLPQTYYGPSIPLGPDWVFGGSTSPASIATSFASPTLSPSTTSTPSTSQTATSTPISFTSNSIRSTTNTPSTSSSLFFPPSSSHTTTSHGISNGTRLAIILSTILGALLLAVLAVILCRVHRRRHGHRAFTQEGNFSNWQLVNPSSAHQPLGAVEEGGSSAFLADEPSMQERIATPILSRILSNRSSHQIEVHDPTALSRDTIHDSDSGAGAVQSDASSLDSVAKREALTRLNASASTIAAGSLFFNPARDNDQGRGVRKSDEEPRQETIRPPRLLDPNGVFRLQNIQPSNGSMTSRVYPESPPSETDERATLLTAERANVGSQAHPLLAPSTSRKSRSLENFTITQDIDPDSPVFGAPPSPRSWIGMGGLSGFAKGLGRLSWFRRMEEAAGTSNTHHSSPSLSHQGAGSNPGSKQGSRPPSDVSFTPAASGNRRYSGLLHPRFTSRPRSDASFPNIEAELGIRPPGIRISGTGSGSGGSGSGKSGGTIYHSASSRPQTPLFASAVHAHHEGELHTQTTPVTLPPELDFGEGDSTIRSVDVLDLPVPERALPLTEPLHPEPAFRPDTASSRGTGLAFPPGLVAVPQWDSGSHSSSSNRREERDILEDDPPQAGGEWSSLRSKKSSSDVGDCGNLLSDRRSPVPRHSTGEQAVQVIAGDHAASETASFSSGLQQADPLSSDRFPVRQRFILTPSASLYASSHSTHPSHSGSGSYSSRPSQHTASHSHEQSHQSSNQESEDGHLPSTRPGINRASLTAIGGDNGPPQLPLFRVLSPMQPTMEAEDESVGTPSRPNTGTSRPTLSEATYAGTLASESTSTGARTTVLSMTGSFEKQ